MKREYPPSIIELSHGIRKQIHDKDAWLTSISSRESLEVTYLQMLNAFGKMAQLRYRLIAWLIIGGQK